MASGLWALKHDPRDDVPARDEYDEIQRGFRTKDWVEQGYQETGSGRLEGAIAGAALAGVGTLMADQRKKREAREDRDERHMESIQQWARAQRYLAGPPTMTPHTPPAPSHASLFPTEDPRWTQ